MPDQPVEENLVSVGNLSVSYGQARMSLGARQRFVAVDNVNFSVKKGSIVGLVGETGCGKSSIGRAILGLIPFSGKVSVAGKRIDAMSSEELKRHRLHMQMIFQDPLSSLNRRKSIKSLMRQSLQLQRIGSRKEQNDRISALIKEVGFDDSILTRYPHQFSGGQRQRISIARALTLHPSFIVCDEAVSALDVSVQAAIINLLLDLRKKHDLTYLFISHDLSVIELISDYIVVLYLGRIVEQGSKKAIMARQMHPYTQILFSTSPEPTTAQRTKKFQKIVSDIPQRNTVGEGCFFASRCPFVMDKCRKTYPKTFETADNQKVACWLYE